MKHLFLVIFVVGCGGQPRNPDIPMALSLEGTTSSTLSALQFTFLINADRYDCATITSTCLKSVADPSDIVELTSPSGGSAKSFVAQLSSDPMDQSFDVTGIPVLDQPVILVVEGVTRDGSVLGASGCTQLPGIVEGPNPAVSVTLTAPATAQTCDPLF